MLTVPATVTAPVLRDPVNCNVPIALVESFEREKVMVIVLRGRRLVLTRRRQVLAPRWYASFRQLSPANRLTVGANEPLMLKTLTNLDLVSRVIVP